MYYLNAIIILVFAIGLVGFGKFASKYGVASIVMGNFLLMMLGIIILSTGFEMLTGEQIITEGAGTTTINKTLQSTNWVDTVLGTVALLFGIAGFIGSWKEHKNSQNPYRDNEE